MPGFGCCVLKIKPRGGVLLLAALLGAAFFVSLVLRGWHPVFGFVSGTLSPLIFAVVAVLLCIFAFMTYVKNSERGR